MPLQNYRAFITGFVEVIEELPQVLKHGTGVIDLGAIALDLDIGDRLFSQAFKRLDGISNSRGAPSVKASGPRSSIITNVVKSNRKG